MKAELTLLNHSDACNNVGDQRREVSVCQLQSTHAALVSLKCSPFSARIHADLVNCSHSVDITTRNNIINNSNNIIINIINNSNNNFNNKIVTDNNVTSSAFLRMKINVV